MSKRFNIKPPNWPKEYTFQEFAKLNSSMSPIITRSWLMDLKFLLEGVFHLLD